jgi:hypothetical protein
MKNTNKYLGLLYEHVDHTNEFRTKIMYVYYIAMEIYVHDYINIFSPFLLSMYNYYVTPFLYHELHINNIKTFQNKNLDSLHNYIP